MAEEKSFLRKIKIISLLFLLPLYILIYGNQKVFAIECSVGTDDCNCDGTCEVNVKNDPFNCGGCGNVCSSGKCNNGQCVDVVGGLVPCGRYVDNPTTPWNETSSCQLCHAIPLISNIIAYLLGIAGILALLFIALGSIASIISMGEGGMLTSIKKSTSKVVYGFVCVLIAWTVVNTVMALFGFIDPMGDGSWKKFKCDLPEAFSLAKYCGDGIVSDPNNKGQSETCDPKESFASYNIRTGGDYQSWMKSTLSCDPTICAPGCVGDAKNTDIGKNCSQPKLYDGNVGASCQKGKYVCDFSLATPEVLCMNTFNNPDYKFAGNKCQDVFDYCCNGDVDTLASLPFTKVKSLINSYKCDDECGKIGKACVGIGLDNSSNLCFEVIDNPFGVCMALNQGHTCNSTFTETVGSTCSEFGSGSTFKIGGTGCYCM